MTKDKAGNELEVPHVTAQQILARTRERKAKSTLLMVIPDEHLARFYGIKDAKTLWAAIKTRFGGNAKSKKMQKNVLKQQFDIFSVSNLEGLEKRYDRFQRLLILLEILEAGVCTKDANQNFLRSLPSAWNNISLIMRNNPDIDNLDIDDLHNNLKVYETYIKASSGSSSNSQNVIVLKHKVAMLSMRVKQFYKKTIRKLEFNGKELIGFDKTKVDCFNCHRRGHFARDCKTARNPGNRGRDAGNAGYRGRDNGKRPAREEDEKSLVVQDGLGTYYWSYQVEEEATDFALMAFTINPSCSSSSNPEENSLANDRFKKGKGFHAFPPPLTRNYMPPKPDLSFARLDDFIYKFKISETVTSLSKDVQEAPETSTVFVEKPKEVRTIFTRSERIPVSDAKPKAAASTSGAKPVNIVGPKQSVNISNSRSTFHKSHSLIRKSFYNATAYSRRNSTERVNTAGLKAVSVVKGNELTAVKALAGCVWRPRGHPRQALKTKGIVDSGCSRHMTGNKAYLADYQEINDGGFVAFGSSRGKITGKGKIRTEKLDFDDVYFVNELKFNLFFVSQMCDKKNSVLFTETECLVLSPNFKLLDESQVLLRVPRTPQQNRVIERKNGTLIEVARTMLADSLLPITFWAEAVNTACYVLNRALVTKHHNKSPYELLNSKSHRLDFMRPFGCPVTMLNTLDPLGKFKGKADEGFLVVTLSLVKLLGYLILNPEKLKRICMLGPQDTNGNAGTQENVDAGKEVSDQHYIVLPLWSFISSTYKSSDDKAEDDKPKDATGSKTVVKQVNKKDQAYTDELNRLMSQEKEVSDETDSLSKEFKQGFMDQRGAAKASSTNSVYTVSNPVNAASTSGTFSAGGPSSLHPGAFIPTDTLLHVDQDDS
uniref:Ribonuclease H-like domain-containing protein n=1 Tax=Tanacetum cinerariifolium TaxID=118510 RepID=A0A6L2LT97_TANCI|nr:ribonuclease H-like domain-containing protein [Tanacetum cinerariifolium]